MDINNDVTKAVSSSLDSTIHLWDVSTGDRIRKIDNEPMESWTVAFSPDGKQIISGAQNGKVHFFNTETGQKEQQMDTRGKFILSIAYVSILKDIFSRDYCKTYLICSLPMENMWQAAPLTVSSTFSMFHRPNCCIPWKATLCKFAR